MKIWNAIFFLVLCYTSNCLAQPDLDVNFSLSPEMLSMGSTGVAAFTDDAFAFHYNPAQLGSWSKTNNLSTGFYTSKVTPYREYFTGMKINNYAICAGYNFLRVLPSLDISVGFGYLNNKFYFGENSVFWNYGYPKVSSDNVFNSFKAYSIGVGFHSAVDLSLGFTFKDYRLLWSDDPAVSGNLPDQKVPQMEEWGILLQIPVYKIINMVDTTSVSENILPFFNISIGTSVSQGCRLLSYGGLDYGAYYEQMAHLGYAFNVGTDIRAASRHIRIIEINWNTQADNSFGYKDNPASSLFPGFGNIEFGKNLIRRESSDRVSRLSGFSVGLANIIVFNSGSISPYYDITASFSGYTIKAQGVLELLPLFYSNRVIDYIAAHVDIKYTHTNAFKDLGYLETTYNGIQLTIKNIQL